MKAIARYSDGLIRVFQVPSHEAEDGRVVELPRRIEIIDPKLGRILFQLKRIMGREWNEVPEYVQLRGD